MSDVTSQCENTANQPLSCSERRMLDSVGRTVGAGGPRHRDIAVAGQQVGIHTDRRPSPTDRPQWPQMAVSAMPTVVSVAARSMGTVAVWCGSTLIGYLRARTGSSRSRGSGRSSCRSPNHSQDRTRRSSAITSETAVECGASDAVVGERAGRAARTALVALESVAVAVGLGGDSEVVRVAPLADERHGRPSGAQRRVQTVYPSTLSERTESMHCWHGRPRSPRVVGPSHPRTE
jgi:hypothetical protein